MIDEDEDTVDEEYAAAFREFGVDVAVLEPEAIGVRIRAEPPELALAMALALDDWSMRNRRARRGGGPRGGRPERSRASDPAQEPAAEPVAERERVDWKLLRDAAIAGDPDPWRVELRRASSVDEPARLLALADSADLATLDPTRLVMLGRALAMADERVRAIEVLKEGFARHPDDFWISHLLATRYAFADEPELERAREHAAIAVSLRPDSLRARGMLAHVLRALGEREAAMRVIFEYIRANPDDGRARFELFAFGADDAAQDERAVRAILARDPTSRGALELLARLLDLRSDWPAAAEAWSRVLASHPPVHTEDSFGGGGAYAERSLGRALEECGRYEEALDAYHRAVDLGWRGRDVNESVARSERLRSLSPRAVTCGLEELAADELLLAARVCQHAGHFARAAELFERHFASDPEAGPTTFSGLYDAVVSAVQAGVGQGSGAAPLASPEAERLRSRALTWMQANLVDLPAARDDRPPPPDGGPQPGRPPEPGPRSREEPSRGSQLAFWRLSRWRQDVRLDPVRDPARLALLPPQEAHAWTELWAALGQRLSTRR
jgi:tetratricopeptide (TPR) repeat protein